MKYVDSDEMRKDIQDMLIVINALTPKDSYGADLLDSWMDKYSEGDE